MVVCSGKASLVSARELYEITQMPELLEAGSTSLYFLSVSEFTNKIIIGKV
jgi:hypothetical protein